MICSLTNSTYPPSQTCATLGETHMPCFYQYVPDKTHQSCQGQMALPNLGQLNQIKTQTSRLSIVLIVYGKRNTRFVIRRCPGISCKVYSTIICLEYNCQYCYKYIIACPLTLKKSAICCLTRMNIRRMSRNAVLGDGR